MWLVSGVFSVSCLGSVLRIQFNSSQIFVFVFYEYAVRFCLMFEFEFSVRFCFVWCLSLSQCLSLFVRFQSSSVSGSVQVRFFLSSVQFKFKVGVWCFDFLFRFVLSHLFSFIKKRKKVDVFLFVYSGSLGCSFKFLWFMVYGLWIVVELWSRSRPSRLS